MKKQKYPALNEYLSPPTKAIRAFCLDCSGYLEKEVQLCPSTTCVLYHYRFGKNPRTKKSLKRATVMSPFLKRIQDGV